MGRLSTVDYGSFTFISFLVSIPVTRQDLKDYRVRRKRQDDDDDDEITWGEGGNTVRLRLTSTEEGGRCSEECATAQ